MIVQMINVFREHGVSISKAEVELFFSSKVSICVKHVFNCASSSSSSICTSDSVTCSFELTSQFVNLFFGNMGRSGSEDVSYKDMFLKLFC